MEAPCQLCPDGWAAPAFLYSRTFSLSHVSRIAASFPFTKGFQEVSLEQTQSNSAVPGSLSSLFLHEEE